MQRPQAVKHAAKERLPYLAPHDPLIGPLNRVRFRELVNEAIASRGPPTVIRLDLDRFKLANELCGHAAGDEALVEAARRIATDGGREASSDRSS